MTDDLFSSSFLFTFFFSIPFFSLFLFFSLYLFPLSFLFTFFFSLYFRFLFSFLFSFPFFSFSLSFLFTCLVMQREKERVTSLSVLFALLFSSPFFPPYHARDKLKLYQRKAVSFSKEKLYHFLSLQHDIKIEYFAVSKYSFFHVKPTCVSFFWRKKARETGLSFLADREVLLFSLPFFSLYHAKEKENVPFNLERRYTAHKARGGGLGSRTKKMCGERLGDGVEYHLMKPTPRR